MSSKFPSLTYEELPADELWWCNTHCARCRRRWENSVGGKGFSCEAKEGITLPCRVVNLTGQVEEV